LPDRREGQKGKAMQFGMESMKTKRDQRLSWIPWKSGLFLAAAIALLELVPSPVPARQTPPIPAAAPAPAASPRFDMVETAAKPYPAAAPTRAKATPAAGEPIAVADYPLRSELPIGRMLSHGEWAWTEGPVPTSGETLVVVNLRAQLLSLYRDGQEIGRVRIVYGADEKPTPTGTFPILEKDAVHFSNLYGGAPMPYMLRLTRDGVAIHGSEVADDIVTHGCVGLPKAFAAMLFRQVKVGDRVVVWRG
jgi:lipoprotein-anchoring transpeptidase ErfK/SrfK